MDPDMGGIIGELEKVWEKGDVFTYWERELQARKQVRAAEDREQLAGVEPKRESLDFLFRTFFPTAKRTCFYRYLLEHSHTMPVLRWLMSCPEKVKLDFLGWLPGNLPASAGRKLDFLINIYTESLRDIYRKILAVMDQEEIDYLADRTANRELRRLLRERREQLATSRKEENQGVRVEAVRIPGWESFFGNKVNLARETLYILQKVDSDTFDHPYNYERLGLLCQGAEGLYRLGWLQDCLVLLLEVYRDFMAKSRLADQDQAAEIYRRLDRLARRLVPVYALVEYPQEPRAAAEQIYRLHLPNLTAEGGSLAYLSFWDKLRETGSTSVFPRTEILAFCRQVRAARNDDRFVTVLESAMPGEDGVRALLHTAEQRFKSRPHEAFVILEFLRGLVASGYITSGYSETCSFLLDAYLKLWRWVPSRVFFNQAQVDVLIPGLGEDSRRKAAKVLQWVSRSPNQVLQFYRDKAELARTGGNFAALEMVVSKLLGV